MPLLSRIPPGRAGRLWLRARLETAERGRSQLDRKLRTLIPEQQRLQILDRRNRREWADAYATARLWLWRTSVLGGQDSVRRFEPIHRARVTVQWRTAVGLSYPVDAAIHAADDRATGRTEGSAADRSDDAPPATGEWARDSSVADQSEVELPDAVGNAASLPALLAFRRTLFVGARLAASGGALLRIDRDIARTRTQLRALDKRWLPALTQALAGLELTLEQSEQDDAIRLRQAQEAGPGGRSSDRRPPDGTPFDRRSPS